MPATERIGEYPACPMCDQHAITGVCGPAHTLTEAMNIDQLPVPQIQVM